MNNDYERYNFWNIEIVVIKQEEDQHPKSKEDNQEPTKIIDFGT